MFKLELTQADMTIVVSAMIGITKFMPDSKEDIERVLTLMLEQMEPNAET